MKALELQGTNKMGLIETPVPVPAGDQLLVKTGAAVICTSDLNDLRGNPFGISLPMVFGHEGAGTVAAVGAGVKGFAVGDVVAAHPVHPCFGCENCLAGMAHLCGKMGHFGVNMQGTFAEYFVVRADRARKVPGGAVGGDVVTAALAEPVCVCLEAIAQARVDAKSSLLVLGDGPFGVMISILAKGMGVGRVVLAGEHEFRMSFAKGCETMNLMVEADRWAALKWAGGSGFDAVILAVGSAEAAAQGLEVLRSKGRLVIFSAVHEPAEVDLFAVHIKELEIIGACNDEDRFDAAMGMMFRKELGLGRLVTHRYRIEEFAEAFAMAATGHDRALKVAFVF